MSSPEDAQKAYNLAMKHSASGNLEGALKWARKAMSMDPNSSQAKILLTSLEKGHMPGSTSTQNQANGSSAEAGTSSSSSGKSSAMPNGTASAAQRRPAAAGASSAAEEKRPQREYTKEQAKIVTQVNKAGRDNDFYGVLGLKKEDKPDENAIKKGYRKVRRDIMNHWGEEEESSHTWGTARLATAPGQERCTWCRRSLQNCLEGLYNSVRLEQKGYLRPNGQRPRLEGRRRRWVWIQPICERRARWGNI